MAGKEKVGDTREIYNPRTKKWQKQERVHAHGKRLGGRLHLKWKFVKNGKKK